MNYSISPPTFLRRPVTAIFCWDVDDSTVILTPTKNGTSNNSRFLAPGQPGVQYYLLRTSGFVLSQE
jgi:hypothetical protein